MAIIQNYKYKKINKTAKILIGVKLLIIVCCAL
jgi:hypothetical protein